jgi:hypothetical protein
MSDELREEFSRRYSQPVENIYRFSRVHVMPGGEVAAVFLNPMNEEEAADERYLVRWFALEQQHNARMPPDLKPRSARQMWEISCGLSEVQKHKMATGIPLDTPYREPTDFLPENFIAPLRILS